MGIRQLLIRQAKGRVSLIQNSWSPLHELVPETPLRHGHAISIDMAYSATLANMRGLLSDIEHTRLLNLFSRAGLSMDHHQFNDDLLEKATSAILKTRDGKLRAAVPSPLGSCTFLNNVSMNEMREALRKHKQLMSHFPRNGEGIDAYVDSGDTGYTEGGKTVETMKNNLPPKTANVLQDDTSDVQTHANGYINGSTNGRANGNAGGLSNGSSEPNNGQENGFKMASV